MLGVCYYPEHWPESRWVEDAAQMKALGLRYVRIGEFAWSRLEPTEGELNFDWLDRAVDVLASAGLEIVMGTPTATPPKWLIDKYPDALPVDIETGHTRGFGSRRHYDFSSENYLREALRISELMAKRYGKHPAVVGWQTDNELCCHDTALSGSLAAKQAFQEWCKARYETVDALNQAWGNVFWSMEYRSFEEIELPILAVTETSPAHRLAYRQFSSDQVVRWHNKMIEVIRQYAPGRFITHNFIPMNETWVDNFDLAENLDFASYDNYPLGRSDLQFANMPASDFKPFMRTGHPDFATYYHDQTRGLTQGGFWIMEQQPGPVNWAGNNPRPAPGMVRLWSLEAFAHGADVLCYFRWRQAPFAQEQMHAGILRPDHSKDEAWYAAEQVLSELQQLDIENHNRKQASVAIITTAKSQWVTEIERQSDSYHFNDVQFEYYSALRQLGLNVDFISPEADFSGYKLLVAPCLPIVDHAFVEKCQQTDAHIVFGPRSGAKTQDFCIPEGLAPGLLRSLVNTRILAVETVRPDCSDTFEWQGKHYESKVWRELHECAPSDITARCENGDPAVIQQHKAHYIATLSCVVFLKDYFRALCRQLSIDTYEFGENIRVSQRGNLLFAFNYNAHTVALTAPTKATRVLGGEPLKGHDVAVWQLNN